MSPDRRPPAPENPFFAPIKPMSPTAWDLKRPIPEPLRWTSEISEAMRESPVDFMVFDALAVKGQSIMNKPLEQRRYLLESAFADFPLPSGIEIVQSIGVKELLSVNYREAEELNGYEGAILERLDRPYKPGVKSPDWRKVKFR